MKKINLKYLKDNLNLKRLIQELDKQESSGGDDIIKDAVLDSYSDILDDDDMEVSITEHLLDNEEELFHKINDLSFQGKLLQTLSKNFKHLRQIHINQSAKDLLEDYYLQCLFSKINKTYYLLVSCINSRSDFQYVYYKTKKEKNLTKELGLLRNKIVKDGYFIPK
jgi:DNA polymerase III gamma/tau subunit